jgi:hypothetical protein
MKKLVLVSKSYSVILAVIIMLQSCTVYKSPVVIEEAINQGPVKVRTINKKSFEYSSLILDSGKIYGVSHIYGISQTTNNDHNIGYKQFQHSENLEKHTLISGDEILDVRVKDPVASRKKTLQVVLITTLAITVPIVVSIIALESLDFSGFSLAN